MGGGGGGGKIAIPPPLPSIIDPAIQEARRRARETTRRRTGRDSTILTGPRGDQGGGSTLGAPALSAARTRSIRGTSTSPQGVRG